MNSTGLSFGATVSASLGSGINFEFFTDPIALLKRGKVLFMHCVRTNSRPYVYSFCQIFWAQRYIPFPTSILESRVLPFALPQEHRHFTLYTTHLDQIF